MATRGLTPSQLDVLDALLARVPEPTCAEIQRRSCAPKSRDRVVAGRPRNARPWFRESDVE